MYKVFIFNQNPSSYGIYIQYLYWYYRRCNKKVGALYNAIEDNELQKRCGDILGSVGAFDRVINQATKY